MLSLLLEHGLIPSGAAAVAGAGLIEVALRHQHAEIAVFLADHGFRLLDHARSIYRERLEKAFVRRGKLQQ